MRLPLSVALLVTVTASAFAQQAARLRAGEEPPQPLRGEIHAIADAAPLRSFKELCIRATAIVDGVVETEAPRMMPGRSTHIETDFWTTINHVFKGSVDSPKIVVSEMGGTFGELHLIMNFPLLQRGGRYVLFLYADKRPGIPPVDGLPRYQAGIFYGTFKVEDGKIRPFFRDPFEGKYTGLTPEAFAAEIADELKR
jgi:hypothetical protein